MAESRTNGTLTEKESIVRLQEQITELQEALTATQARESVAQATIAALEAQLALRNSVGNGEPNARLNTLLAICAALLVSHDVNAIMQLVVDEARALLAGTQNALLFLAEPNADFLVLQAASTGDVPPMLVHPRQSVAGRAYCAPRAMLIVGPELEQAIDEFDQTQRALLRSMIEPWPPSSALAAPLRVERQALGALVLYGGAHGHLYHPRDLPFIQALADLTAVAIDEVRQRAQTAALQRDLARSRIEYAEAQARLDAAQAQLLQSAKLAAVGELSASVAHEINNPLYAARNSLYLVEQDLPPEAPQRAFLEIAQTELGRIARIITRMRDFYRPSRSELLATDVNNLLDETIELVRTHLRHSLVTLNLELAGDMPSIIAHADQLRQVFLNIILNACDAMPEGGCLTVGTRCRYDNRGQQQAVEVRIADNGVGIPAEHLEHLFEPFYTTKPQGTGLGLAISAHIVTQHSGRISVESTVGTGSLFTIILPLNDNDPASTID